MNINLKASIADKKANSLGKKQMSFFKNGEWFSRVPSKSERKIRRKFFPPKKYEKKKKNDSKNV